MDALDSALYMKYLTDYPSKYKTAKWKYLQFPAALFRRDASLDSFMIDDAKQSCVFGGSILSRSML